MSNICENSFRFIPNHITCDQMDYEILNSSARISEDTINRDANILLELCGTTNMEVCNGRTLGDLKRQAHVPPIQWKQCCGLYTG